MKKIINIKADYWDTLYPQDDKINREIKQCDTILVKGRKATLPKDSEDWGDLEYENGRTIQECSEY